MNLQGASGRGCALGAAHIAQRVRGTEFGCNFIFHKSPGAHVFGFFLNPDKIGGVWILLKLPSQHIPRKRIELLDFYYCTIVDLFFEEIFKQVITDFAASHQYSGDLFFGWKISRDGNFLEVSTGKLVEG